MLTFQCEDLKIIIKLSPRSRYGANHRSSDLSGKQEIIYNSSESQEMSDAYLSGDSHRSNRSTEGKWAVQTYQKKKEQRVGVYHHDSDGGRRERRGNQQPINSRLGLLFILMVCGVAMHVLYQRYVFIKKKKKCNTE